MRKILLGTTAVIGAALIGATTAQAQQAPTVRLGGYIIGQAVWTDDDFDYARGVPTGVNGAGQQRRARWDFKNEVEFSIMVDGKAANGMTYGAVIEVQNDGTGGTIFDIDEAYIYMGSPTLGTIRFGEEDSAASLLQVRPPSVTGSGVDGDWDDTMLSSTAFTGGGPSLITGINDGNDSTKIVYLSPQWFGFDFGVSFSPNRNEGDRIIAGRAVDSLSTGSTTVNGVTVATPLSATVPQRDRTGLENEISGAIRYRGSFQNVGIAASFAAQRADAASVNADGTGIANRAPNVTAYSVGASVTAFGFTFGGEYTWGAYSGAAVAGAPLARGRDDSSHWALGVTYTMGAWAFGGFFGQGEQDNGGNLADRQQTIWGLGTAYTLAPGLQLFANYGNLSDDNVRFTATRNGVTGTLVDRSAQSFMVGTRLAF
jgi:predicted porin